MTLLLITMATAALLSLLLALLLGLVIRRYLKACRTLEQTLAAYRGKTRHART